MKAVLGSSTNLTVPEAIKTLQAEEKALKDKVRGDLARIEGISRALELLSGVSGDSSNGDSPGGNIRAILDRIANDVAMGKISKPKTIEAIVAVAKQMPDHTVHVGTELGQALIDTGLSTATNPHHAVTTFYSSFHKNPMGLKKINKGFFKFVQ